MPAIYLSYSLALEVKNKDLCSKEDKDWIKKVDVPHQKKNQTFFWEEKFNYKINSAHKNHYLLLCYSSTNILCNYKMFCN